MAKTVDVMLGALAAKSFLRAREGIFFAEASRNWILIVNLFVKGLPQVRQEIEYLRIAAWFWFNFLPIAFGQAPYPSQAAAELPMVRPNTMVLKRILTPGSRTKAPGVCFSFGAPPTDGWGLWI